MTVPLGGTRRKQVTHAALEEAALRLFAEQGYEGTTVEEIAAAAGVAVRTFFRHFSSKQHVLFGDAAHGQVAALRQALARLDATEDPIAALKAVMDEVDMRDPADLAQVLLRFRLMAAQPTLIATYLLLIAELQTEVAVFVARCRGAAPTDFYPQLIAAAAASSWHASVTTWVAADGEADLTELRKSAFAALTAGLDPAGQT